MNRLVFALGKWTVYFWAWAKKTIQSCDKVMIYRILVIDPAGKVVMEDDDEKTIAVFPGRMTKKAMREAVKSFAIMQLSRSNPLIRIPLENVVYRKPKVLDRILGRAKPQLKDLR